MVSTDEIVSQTRSLFLQIEERPNLLKKLGHQIYSLNEGIAHQVALVFSKTTNIELEDLRQIAGLGLWNAVRRFDIYEGASFASYAYPQCRKEVLHYRRDYSMAIRPPRTWQERTDRARSLARKINASLPPDQHLSEAVVAGIEYGWPEDEWRQAIASTKHSNIGSIDLTDSDYPIINSSTPMDALLGDEESAAKQEAIAVLLAVLPEQTRQYIIHSKIQGMTPAAIARLYGVSSQQVSREIQAAMKSFGVTS